MKSKLASYKIGTLRNKVWFYLIVFSVAILSFLWFFQIIFLNSYYELVKTNEIGEIANKIAKSYESDDFEEALSSIAYKEGVCIELIYNSNEIYSANTLNIGCVGDHKNDSTYMKYKKEIINSGKEKKVYKLINSRFNNKIILYGLKLDDDYYVIVNASLEPLTSTINILASQMIYVTIVVFILSFLISYYISKHISKPIINLNEVAKKMAKGDHQINYDIHTDIEELNSLATTLNAANEELAKTDELRRELMANVSHDLKTPLTMIKAYAEMVRDLTYDNKEKRESNLNTIIEETDRLNLLVNDMLELSKMQSNVVELHLEQFDLNELISTVVSRFSYLEETEKYHFEYNGISNAMIEADKRKIEQVIYNLVGNATNYVGKDKTVIINLKEEYGTFIVEVIDHGPGMDEKELDFIWDKYYRIDKKHKRNMVGTGLGLSIVKNVFLMHHFEYGVYSKKDKGTTFYFKVKKEK